jgi:hypothetical protein
LFCYAIVESYEVKELSDYALSNFPECLRVVSPEDFAELMGVIATHTDADPSMAHFVMLHLTDMTSWQLARSSSTPLDANTFSRKLGTTRR